MQFQNPNRAETFIHHETNRAGLIEGRHSVIMCQLSYAVCYLAFDHTHGLAGDLQFFVGGDHQHMYGAVVGLYLAHIPVV